jgi:tripartite-type tricarboxylate transporter receptor subunit TctC
VPDLLSGAITGAMTEVSTVLQQHGDKVRIIGVASAKRAQKLPDVATMIEQGVKDFTAASYVGILAPAATPAEIVKSLEGALIKALAQKATQEKFLNTGAELVPDNLQTSKGFGDYIKKEFELSAEAAKIAGLKPA